MDKPIFTTALKFVAGIIAVVALTSVFLQRRPASVGEPRNCYETAQRATTLIVTPTGGSGSGFVVRRDKRLFIFTAAHVVDDCDTVTARNYIRHAGTRVGHTEFSARVIARNDSLDAALLWMIAPAEYFDSVEFANSDVMRVGASVYHVGNYYGADFDSSVSIGIVSQIGIEQVGWPWKFPLDQTTAFVTYGSSGGGIFRHSDNRVIGILVGGCRPGVSDINFFVPVRALRQWAKSEGLLWAMYGDASPEESTLWLAASVAERNRKALLPLPPPLLLHEIARPD